MGAETHGHTKGGTHSPTYMSWHMMMARCYTKTNCKYKRYGGRGITVCKEWHDFETFLNDMGKRPKNKTLDSRDNDGNYCKDNCRWATTEQQASNKGMYKNNTSGMKGVIKDSKNRWRASVCRNGERLWLYSGKSYDEACAARLKWEKENAQPQ